jgi:hypothetical protein
VRIAHVSPPHLGSPILRLTADKLIRCGVHTTQLAMVVVHVHDPGLRGDRLRDLVHVLPGGKARADVEKLPDPGLGGENRTTRSRNARAARADSAVLGKALIAASAAWISASKLSVPPGK